MENKQTQKDFFRLVKTHNNLISLINEEQFLISLISTELQNSARTSAPVFTQGTTENDIFDKLIDSKLDIELPKILTILSKYSNIMWQIIDKEIECENADFDDIDKYLQKENAKE